MRWPWGQPALLSSTTLLCPLYSAQMRLLGVFSKANSIFRLWRKGKVCFDSQRRADLHREVLAPDPWLVCSNANEDLQILAVWSWLVRVDILVKLCLDSESLSSIGWNRILGTNFLIRMGSHGKNTVQSGGWVQEAESSVQVSPWSAACMRGLCLEMVAKLVF